MTLRVLAPLDGSDLTWRAFEEGLRLLAGRPDLVVTAFCVRQPGFDNVDEETIQRFDDDEDDEIFPNEASAQRVLERARELGAKRGVTVEGASAVGKPFDLILEEVRRHDVLLMHHLSPSSLRDALKGSRTEDLARKAKASILLVRPPAEG